MLHVRQAIVVEGKYDKIKLSSIVDATILVTHGFQIYHDTELLNLIREYAKTTGIILMTDSDQAGFQIRNYIKGAITEGQVYHVYIPDVYGKERRKVKPSSEGKLGVEGIDRARLVQAFEEAGVLVEEPPEPPQDPITRYDLYALGLTGSADSKSKRTALQKALQLPEHLSTSALLDVLNLRMTRREFFEYMQTEMPSDGE